MSERLEAALAELTAALADFRLDQDEGARGEGAAGGARVPGAKPKAAPKRGAAQRVATGSDVAYHNDQRLYLILVHPERPELVGLVAGEGARTWVRIEATLRGGRLAGSGARLRRVPSVEEAQRLWTQVHPDRPLPRVPLDMFVARPNNP
jgi:hypothetical protein